MISKIALIAALAGAFPAAAYAQAAPAEDPAAAKQAAAADIIVTGRFIDTGAKSAMKQDVRVLDTPFSVSSYSNSFVKSLETQNVADLYNYMTGLKKSGATAYDITLRGFKSSGDDRNAIMVDGLPGLSGRYSSPPTIGIDHIELVKGPMSVLYGQIQPGGFVNMITKKPKEHEETTIEVRGNTFFSKYRGGFDHNGITGSFDSTGKVTSDGALLYRVVGSVGDNDGFRDYSNQKQQYLAPSLRWHVGPNTTLTVQGEYRRTRDHFDIGLAAPYNGKTRATSTAYDVNLIAPLNTTYQQPNDFRVELGKTASAFLVHSFGDWRLSASFRHVDYKSRQKDTSSIDSYFSVPNQTYYMQRRARQLDTYRTYDYGDINLNGKFETFGFQHKLLIGVNGGKDHVEENRTKFYNAVRNPASSTTDPGGCRPNTATFQQTCLDIALYNPNYSAFPSFDSLPAFNPNTPGDALLLTDRKIKSQNYGIYLSDLITITDWLKVSASVRKFREESTTRPDMRNTPLIVRTKVTKRDFLPSAGILIQPTKHITFYGSYAESFVPVDPGLYDNNNQNNFNPLQGKQYEVGLKTENLLDNRLNFTTALYRIDQTGQITQYVCPLGSCSLQIGKARSDGFEFEGNATPMRNLQLIFGYTHILAKVRTAPTAPVDQSFQIGRELPNVAKDAANLWSRYDWENGLGLGVGVTYTGPREGILPTAATDLLPLHLPGYTVVDAGLYYTKEHYSLNLKVGNLFDKKYYESSGGGSQGRAQIQAGIVRNVTLTARVTL